MPRIFDINEPQAVVINKCIYILFGLVILFTMTTIALAAAILGVVVNRLESKNRTSLDKSEPISLVDQIKIDDLMKHLEQLQVFADRSNGTRAIGTSGFNDTLDYITDQLKQNTNLIIQHQYFTVRNSIIQGTPQLQTEINGNITNHVYLTDFTQILFSSRADFVSFVPVVAIPNLGCSDADWTNVLGRGAIALVMRGGCSYIEKSKLAEKYQVRGLLIYNDGLRSDNLQPIQGVKNNLNTTIPAYFLSYHLGIQLANASANPHVMMNIDVADIEGVANICADTPSGDPTKTIVVGAHSDGVQAGSGINDNGSGTVANLVLALNLARLFQRSSSSYSTYQYRVRFCWWGAEELGLIGSLYHLAQASLANTTVVGERVEDYLVNLNCDMVASPNYIFGILNVLTAPVTTPSQALNGTGRMSDLFRQWFNEQKLPWSNTTISGSDLLSFLAAGIPVGDVHTGTATLKSADERDRYSAMLGTGNGGIANAGYDPCYHRQCDRITNINTFAFEKVAKSVAYAIEYLGRLNDLEKWIYPQGRSTNFAVLNKNQLDNFQNDPNLIST